MAIKITKGSPNIFRDLGFSRVEAEHLRVRAALMLSLERPLRAAGSHRPERRSSWA